MKIFTPKLEEHVTAGWGRERAVPKTEDINSEGCEWHQNVDSLRIRKQMCGLHSRT